MYTTHPGGVGLERKCVVLWAQWSIYVFTSQDSTEAHLDSNSEKVMFISGQIISSFKRG